MENGPNLIHVDGKVIAAMCRCGFSKNQTYCDGQHVKNGFIAESKELVVLDQ